MAIINPKISIVIPVYFYNHFVQGMFESLLMQDCEDFEVIVVFNGLLELEYLEVTLLIKKIFDNSKVNLRFYFEKEKGANPSRQIGVERAHGEYILFMDSDDQLAHRSVISEVLKVSESIHPDIISINIQHGYIKSNKVIKGNVVFRYKSSDRILRFTNNFKMITNEYGTNIVARFVKKELFRDIKFLNLPFVQDWNISTKIFLHANTFYFINKPGYYWIFRENSISKKKSITAEKHRDSFRSIEDIVKFYKNNGVDYKHLYFLNDRIIRFCFQHVSRSEPAWRGNAIMQSKGFLKKELNISYKILPSFKLIIMLLLLKFPLLLRVYVKYNPSN